MDGQPILEIERPRSATELIGATFSLYRRHPWLFLALAAVVVVPYDAISLLGRPDGPLHGAVRVIVEQVLGVADFALVLPLISALHVHAVEDVRLGREPDLRSVARRGIASLRIVSPAVFLSLLGILAGLIALIVPGILLALRWAVVAQAGSLGAKGWRNALDRSAGLTEGHRQHVFGLLALVVLITAVPSAVLLPVFGFGAKVTVVSFIADTAVGVATSSFTALAVAFLYFDLTARFQTEGASRTVDPDPGPQYMVPPTGHPLDPASWSDADRPSGWYVNPDSPWRMRYWLAGGEGVWIKRTAKTPKATLAEWRDMRFVRKNAERPEEPA